MEAKLRVSGSRRKALGTSWIKEKKTLQTAMDSALHGVAGGHYGLYIFIHSDVRDFDGISRL